MVKVSGESFKVITPEYLNKIIQGVEDQVSWLNMYLIKRMAKRIVTAFNTMQDELIIPSTISDYHKLISAGMVGAEIEKEIIKQAPRLQKEIKKAFIDSAEEIAKYNRHEEKKLIEIGGMKASELPSDKAFARVAKENHMTIEEVKALEEAYSRTNGTLKNYTQTTAQQTEKDYLRVCDEAFMKVKHGVSLNTACVEALDDLAKEGVHAVSYGNRVETIETAVTRAVRTGINQANSEIVIRRCSELGTAFVKVSSHLGARVTKNNDYTNHSWWQGKIYHLDWNNPILSQYKTENHKEDTQENKYPDFIKSTGYGNILGLCGINCRHTFSAFYPDLQEDTEDTFDSEENEKRFRAEQQARAMERKIREYKRRIEALKEFDDEESKAKRKILNSQLRTLVENYMAFCKNNGLKPNNMRMQIGTNKE